MGRYYILMFFLFLICIFYVNSVSGYGYAGGTEIAPKLSFSELEKKLYELIEQLPKLDKGADDLFARTPEGEIDMNLQQIQDAFENRDYVDVIVWLKNNEFTSPSYQENYELKKKEIARIQEMALSELSSENFMNLRKLVATNGFIITINKEGFEQLKDNEFVGALFIDREIELTLSESVPLINATRVQNNLNITGQGVGVCVLDSGIDYTHQYLGGCIGQSCRVRGGYDFCVPLLPFFQCFYSDNDPMDENGHGTHVAGIIASSSNNYRGVAPDAHLAAVKVLNSAGRGTLGALSQGIDYCVTNKMGFDLEVITMSLGDGIYTSSTCPTSINNAIQNAVNAGFFIDASSGNDASTTGISYPACAPGVTSVGGTYDSNLGLVNWSNCIDNNSLVDNISCSTNRWQNLDLLAPGAVITSTTSSQGSECEAPFPNGLGDCSGTSMAAPHVAGLAALIRQLNPDINANQIEAIFVNSGKPIFDPLTALTFPRIDAYAAFEQLEPVLSISGQSSQGNNLTFRIRDATHPNYDYFLLFSTGTTPGITFGNQTIPLNHDFLLELSLFNPLAIGLLNNMGQLNGNGQATAFLTIPNLNVLDGFLFYAGAIILDPSRPFPASIVGIVSPKRIIIGRGDNQTVAGWWQFNEGSGDITLDSTNHILTGQLMGGATWTQGVSGSALDFNGNSSYVVMDDGINPLTITQHTFEAWIKREGRNGNHFADMIIGKDGAFVIGIGDTLYTDQVIYSFGNMQWGPGSQCSGSGWCSGGGQIQNGVWTHIAVQYDGTYIKTFVNGQLTGTQTATFNPQVINNFGIGARIPLSVNLEYFNGSIDDVRISSFPRY